MQVRSGQRSGEALKGLKAREFLFLCEELAMAALPAGFPAPERRVMWTILQLYWGSPAVHFELQPMVARGQVELGLHFEGSVEQNDACAAMVAARAPEVMAAVGPGWELEIWTPSWRRLHRVFPFERLTRPLADEVGASLAVALTTLQPLVVAMQQR